MGIGLLLLRVIWSFRLARSHRPFERLTEGNQKQEAYFKDLDQEIRIRGLT